jgi:hypothetical protein
MKRRHNLQLLHALKTLVLSTHARVVSIIAEIYVRVIIGTSIYHSSTGNRWAIFISFRLICCFKLEKVKDFNFDVSAESRFNWHSALKLTSTSRFKAFESLVYHLLKEVKKNINLYAQKRKGDTKSVVFQKLFS